MPGYPTRVRPSSADRGYGGAHEAARKRLLPLVLAGGVRCARCGEPIVPGEPWDLGHNDYDRSQYSGPEHARCNRATASRRRWKPPPVEPEPERQGLPASDERWQVPWLRELRRVPADAVWPRYMTVPHPRAVDSIGPAFIESAETREGGLPLRWWQKLVATRLLEVDDEDRLVWEIVLLTMARQLGKSWLLRELLLWRIHQGDRFGEPQDVLHTGKDLQVCKEVLRPALYWAEEQPGYKVGRANGEQYIEWLADHSRWMLRSRASAYGYSVSTAAVDEAWAVGPHVVDEALTPTMVARKQPQLWLVSTAHRQATPLMLLRRQVALANLEVGDGDLLIEWSAPRGTPLDDVDSWRAASPHWTPQRRRLIEKQLEAVEAGEAEVSEDEMDPVEAFKAQWRNEWPNRPVPTGAGSPLLQPGLWGYLCEPGVTNSGGLFVAVEDNWGNGAAVAAAARTADGRIEVDGWLCDNWDAALFDVQRLDAIATIERLLVGASMLDSMPPGMSPVPHPAGQAEIRVGLPLFRELAAAGALVHDATTEELDRAVQQAQVKELSSGLVLVSADGSHLVRALVWAVSAAHRPVPMPTIY
jgi:hypothetical protein